MKLIPVLCVCAMALSLASCGGNEAPEEAANAAVADSPDSSAGSGSASEALEKLGDKKMVVQQQGGATIGSNVDLPEGFPGDITLPADLNVMSTSTPMPNMQMVMGISPSAPSEVAAELRASMAEAGWTEAAFQEMTPQMTRIDFEKDDRMANVTVTLNGDTSAVQLMTGPKLR